jgi:Ca-activated chloride channel family protein
VNTIATVVAACALAASCARPPVARPTPQPLPASVEPATDVVFAIDMSKSMMETDVPPSRLEATKLAVSRFVAKDNVDRIGIVVFSQEGKQLAPLGSRAFQLQETIASLRIGDILDLGTGIGDGLAVAVDEVRAGGAKRQAVILISDGDNNWAAGYDVFPAIPSGRAALGQRSHLADSLNDALALR